jgi:hypothetical protein
MCPPPPPPYTLPRSTSHTWLRRSSVTRGRPEPLLLLLLGLVRPSLAASGGAGCTSSTVVAALLCSRRLLGGKPGGKEAVRRPVCVVERDRERKDWWVLQQSR